MRIVNTPPQNRGSDRLAGNDPHGYLLVRHCFLTSGRRRRPDDVRLGVQPPAAEREGAHPASPVQRQRKSSTKQHSLRMWGECGQRALFARRTTEGRIGSEGKRATTARLPPSSGGGHPGIQQAGRAGAVARATAVVGRAQPGRVRCRPRSRPLGQAGGRGRRARHPARGGRAGAGGRRLRDRARGGAAGGQWRCTRRGRSSRSR